MSAPIDSTALSSDARGLEGLKSRARSDPQSAVKDAAKKFEAVFLQQILKQMRASLPEGDPIMNSSAMKMQTEMLDQHLADKLSQRGMGLAEALTRHMERALPKKDVAADASATNATTPATAAAASGAAPKANTASGVAGALAYAKVANVSTSVAKPAVATDTSTKKQSFVESMLEHAEGAAKLLKVPSAFVLGQAALESAWGTREIKGPDGASSHNLFGIKAGAGWTGATVDAMTTEVVDGVAQKVVQKFRAYSSYAEGFADYARLLLKSGRYSASVGADDAHSFASGLQRGGYATDPKYATKLAGVIASVDRASSSVSAGR